MSAELENQINEELFTDKLSKFIKTNKKLIICLIILIITIPSIYHANKAYERNKNEKIIENYSQIILNLSNQVTSNSIKELNKLLETKNELIIIATINKLIEINLKQGDNKNSILIIDNIINSKKLSQTNTDLLKIKKALLIFDDADENTMLNLLDVNNRENKFYILSMQILNDFYISKKQYKKSDEIQKKLNEK